jgi:hypothetical protein
MKKLTLILAFMIVMLSSVYAQFGIPIVKLDHPMTSGHPHIIKNSVVLHHPCNGCDHDINVDFEITEDLIKDKADTYIGEWFHLTNKDLTCTAHFTVCSMVQYKEPNVDANFHDTLITRDTLFGVDSLNHPTIDTITIDTTITKDPWTVVHHAHTMTRHDGDMTHATCWYDCGDSISVETKSLDYWDFHFGCVEVTLAPGESTWAFDGWNKVNDQIIAHRNGGGVDGTDKTISLSQDTYDGNGTDWKFLGQYTDFLDGCGIDTNMGCNFANKSNIETGQTANDCACCVNGWQMYNKIKQTLGGHLTSTIGFPTGNQVTMYTMKPYPALFKGVLTNAPAGTQLIIYASKDTMSDGMPKMDSGRISTDTLSGCLSDSLGFSFPFLISRMDDPGMRFQVILPNNSCANIENGRRIQLNAEVFARTTTSDYDSGAFMYWAHAVYIRDTTPPSITNFVLHQVDSNKLAIFIQGHEDTTMIDKGYVKYRVNGGTEKLILLRYESNDSVNMTTKFLDTLVTSVSHPQILIRGYLGNQLGLLDSTALDTCQLIYPQRVDYTTVQNLQVENLTIDHIGKTLSLSVKGAHTTVTIDLITIDGKAMRLAEGMGNDFKIVKSFSSLASGAYFIVIRSGGELLVKRVIL